MKYSKNIVKNNCQSAVAFRLTRTKQLVSKRENDRIDNNNYLLYVLIMYKNKLIYCNVFASVQKQNKIYFLGPANTIKNDENVLLFRQLKKIASLITI